MTNEQHFVVECIGSQREANAPPMLNLRIKDIRLQSGGWVGRADVYPISIENAIQLRKELSDFLNANNVPTR